jgi:hypothetical protein
MQAWVCICISYQLNFWHLSICMGFCHGLLDLSELTSELEIIVSLPCLCSFFSDSFSVLKHQSYNLFAARQCKVEFKSTSIWLLVVGNNLSHSHKPQENLDSCTRPKFIEQKFVCGVELVKKKSLGYTITIDFYYWINKSYFISFDLTVKHILI